MLEHPKDFEASKATVRSIETPAPLVFPMGNQQETVRAWVAAHLDSDGSIGFNIRMRHRSRPGSNIRPHFLPWITFSNNHEGLAKAFALGVNELGVGCSLHMASLTVAGNENFVVTIGGAKRAFKLLPQVIPYLFCKRDRAQAVINWVDSRFQKPMNVTYSVEEIDLALSTRTGSSETLRRALLKAIGR